MKIYAYALIFALFLVSIANLSYAFTFNVTPVTAKVNSGETACFNLTISSDKDDRFVMHTNGLLPWMTLENVGSIKAGETKTIKLYASPFYTTKAGLYKVSINLESIYTGESKSRDVFITVIKNISSAINKIYVTGSLKPTGHADIRIEIKNFGTVSLQNILLKFSVNSLNATIDTFGETIERLDPGDTKIVEKSISFKPLIDAERYEVVAEIFYNGRLLSSKKQYFNIISTPVIETNTTYGLAFVGRDIKIEVKNNGNLIGKNIRINKTLGHFNSKFYYHVSGPMAIIKDDCVEWIINELEPGESVIIEFQINYLPLIVIIVIVGLAAWFVLFKVRIIDIKKQVIQTKEMKNGTEFTVSLDIKNRLGKDANSVVIKDFVPMIFKVKSFTGLKPVTKKVDDGTEIIWRIRKIKSDEERIFSYKISPVIGIDGSVQLPKAKIFYKVMDNLFVKKSGLCKIGNQ